MILSRTLALADVTGQIEDIVRVVAPGTEGRLPTRMAESSLNGLWRAVKDQQQIQLLLTDVWPKNADPRFVLGAVPDLAEQLALGQLQELCDRVQRVYAPGARLTVCIDTRTCADVLGLTRAQAESYAHRLQTLAHEAEHTSFEVLIAEGLLGLDMPLASAGPRRLADFSRFFGEERGRAFVQRWLAHPAQLRQQFPFGVPVSAHPESCDGVLGLDLWKVEGEWLPPWQAVAMDLGGHFRLMPRARAERLGGSLVWRRGRPHHYVYAG